MARELQDAVVVITGASSGIGRATAMAFAGQGAKLVLAARGTAALQQVVDQCHRRGAQAVAVETDITIEEQIHRLAQRAIDEYGRIDVWVNNAAVVLFGRFLDVPADSFRRVMETNFFGTVNCTREALKQFVQQGRGALIQVASVLGDGGIPYASAYVSSKAALLGLAASLREELQGTNIRISTILPASTDTPMWQHSGNYTGKQVQPIGMVYDPEDVATAILRSAIRPRPLVYVGSSGRLIGLGSTAFPALRDRITRRVVDSNLFQHQETAPPTDGNLFESSHDTYIRGGWKWEQSSRFPRALALAASIIGAASAFWWLRPKPSPRARAGKRLVKLGKKLAA